MSFATLKAAAIAAAQANLAAIEAIEQDGPTPPPVTSFADQVGIWPGNGYPSPAPFATQLGLPKFPWLMEFLQGDTAATMESSATELAQWATTNGGRLILPVNFCSNDQTANVKAVAAGSQDAMLTAVGNAAVANGQADAVIRPGWEMNLSINGAGNVPGITPALYTQWWNQHVVPVMRAVPGNKFLFAWNPSIAPSNPADAFLPEPGNVDIIAIDIYDRYPGNKYPGAAAAWQFYLSGANPSLNMVSAWAKQLECAIGIGEGGLGWNDQWGQAGGDNAIFVNNLAAWMEAQTQEVLYWIVWSGAGLPSPSSPNATAALKALCQ